MKGFSGCQSVSRGHFRNQSLQRFLALSMEGGSTISMAFPCISASYSSGPLHASWSIFKENAVVFSLSMTFWYFSGSILLSLLERQVEEVSLVRLMPLDTLLVCEVTVLDLSVPEALISTVLPVPALFPPVSVTLLELLAPSCAVLV